MNEIFKRLSVWFLITGALMVLVPMLLLGTARAQEFYPGDEVGISRFCKSQEAIDTIRDAKDIQSLENIWDKYQASKECAVFDIFFAVEVIEHIYTFVDTYGAVVEIYKIIDVKGDIVYAIHRRAQGNSL